MTGVQITIEDAAVNAAIDRVDKAGGDTLSLMHEFVSAMLFSVERRFETETAPDGTPWTPLRPRTAARRIGGKRRGTENILRVTGRLYQSLTGEASAREAAVGTNLHYAGIHQTGGTIDVPERSATIRLRKVKGRTRFAKRAHKRARDVDVTIGAHQIVVPARPYLGFSETDRTELLAIAEDHFQAAIDGGGAR